MWPIEQLYIELGIVQAHLWAIHKRCHHFYGEGGAKNSENTGKVIYGRPLRQIWQILDPSHLKNADFLNGWSLTVSFIFNFLSTICKDVSGWRVMKNSYASPYFLVMSPSRAGSSHSSS